jgi:hypothetical protein
VVEDPRIVKDGVTTADLQEQFDHNMRVRDLVSEVNKLVAARPDLAAKLVTPRIRYSKPGLQTQITYLYSVTTATDQKIGRDVIERYQTLRKELDQLK